MNLEESRFTLKTTKLAKDNLKNISKRLGVTQPVIVATLLENATADDPILIEASRRVKAAKVATKKFRQEIQDRLSDMSNQDIEDLFNKLGGEK